ncbi:MAG: ATP-binding protein [Spirochaetales bacterium]
MKQPSFPFSALVGQEALKTALIVNAVDPSIGGVLIRGQKGTGKTTAVRAFQSILPPIKVVKGCIYHCSPEDLDDLCASCRLQYEKNHTFEEDILPIPLVNLPLNATEDRIVGTLQWEVALAEGSRRFEPGLLAMANRGILYIDEVNLLEDHLVDLLLDAAATGINRVEREGVSYTHPARFLLIGTMNPEEGELRPQFLDRFGLCVHVSTLANAIDRSEIVRRKIQFENNPLEFAEKWEVADRLLSECIIEARERLKKYPITDEVLTKIVDIAQRAGTAGHRTELTLFKTARALASFTEAPQIQMEHIREAALLVLPHRIEVGPFQEEGKIIDRIEALFSGDGGEMGEGYIGDGGAFRGETGGREGNRGEAARERTSLREVSHTPLARDTHTRNREGGDKYDLGRKGTEAENLKEAGELAGKEAARKGTEAERLAEEARKLARQEEETLYEEEYGIDPLVLEQMQVPGSTAAGSIVFEYLKKKLLRI